MSRDAGSAAVTAALDALDDEQRELLRAADVPRWTAPMLATLTHEHFSDPDWIYERKLDGMRLLAFRSGGGEVRLLTRNRERRNAAFPEIAEALEDLSVRDFVLDGEVVAFAGNVTSFSRLQPRMNVQDEAEARDSGVAVTYYAFDLLHLGGYDVTRLPLRARKSLLRRAFDLEDPLRTTRHRNEHGEAYLREACERGWEGLIAKDARSAYAHSRSRKWLKFKCGNRQEFVIGGWTDPGGERHGFGALLLGVYDGDELVYAGKVGTGFDGELLHDLAAKLRARERKTPPFADHAELPGGDVHWATPELVGEVGFTEWTDDGRLRHPRFLGLRHDKPARDVVREDPS